MPELPEVETTRRGIEPHLRGRRFLGAAVREPRLRWPVPGDLGERVAGQWIASVERRARYLLLRTGAGAVLVHLGMTGSLRLVGAAEAPAKHDHLDLVLDSGRALRFADPRRFGAVLWLPGEPAAHPLLADLGPEPLGDGFGGDRLYDLSRGRRGAVKPFLMDNAVVVGVGNIYASEALFLAGIDPRRPAGRVSRPRYAALAARVKAVLAGAIAQGGTVLGEFTAGEPAPGYFRQELAVYGRGGQPCRRCGQPLREIRLAGRGTVFCPRCQR